MAAGSTYTPIATGTASNSSTASITFNSLGSYTDIVIIGQFGWQTADDYLRITFNGDTTASNYSMTNVRGDGTNAESNRYSGAGGKYDLTAFAGTNGTLDSIARINVMNYSNSTTYKTCVSRLDFNKTGSGALASVTLWRNTAAITSITLSEADGGSFLSGSTFTLYGILAA